MLYIFQELSFKFSLLFYTHLMYFMKLCFEHFAKSISLYSLHYLCLHGQIKPAIGMRSSKNFTERQKCMNFSNIVKEIFSERLVTVTVFEMLPCQEKLAEIVY
jgi:hypothetical protein